MGDLPIEVVVIYIVVVLLSIAIHEWAHAFFADLAGDPTPRMMGRVTLNPIKHLDPVGTVFIVITSFIGWGIGWGKPVMVNPSKMKNPRWDHFTSVAAGPISNLVQAVIYATIFRLFFAGSSLNPDAMAQGTGLLAGAMLIGVIVNIGLFLFNLLPLGPLDGHWLVGAFLPEPARTQWYQFNRGIGSIIFLVIVLAFPQVLGFLLGPIRDIITSILLGTGRPSVG